jgi:hypothetical protein
MEEQEQIIPTAEEARKLRSLASDGEWEHGVNENPPSISIDSSGGGAIAFIQPFGDIRTMMREGREFNHGDAIIIVRAVNSFVPMAECIEELLEENAKLRGLLDQPDRITHTEEEVEGRRAIGIVVKKL